MTCERCGDTGRYVVEETVTYGDSQTRTSSSRPCACRQAIPPRQGKATWWSSETVFARTVKVGVKEVIVRASAEVPMSEDNYRVHRYGNRYWPTTMSVEPNAWPILMLAEDTRALAQALLDAADACDQIDNADSDPCGHWAPCDCAKSAGERPAVPA